MFADKIGENCSTTGTGTYTTGGAFGAFRTWRTYFASLSQAFYFAQNAAGTKWEAGWGIFTQGGTDTLTRNVLGSSNGGALVSWAVGDAPYYLYSAPSSVALASLINGGQATARAAWAPSGMSWWDISAGLAVSWIDKLFNGTADVRRGLYDAVKGVYFGDGRRPFTAVGAANKTVGANDINGFFTYDTAAGARTVTLPVGSTMKDGYRTSHLALSSANGLVLTPDAGDPIDFGAAGVTSTVGGQTPFSIVWDAAGARWRTTLQVITKAPFRRQTVQAGPVDAGGLPTFWPLTNGALALAFQNVTALVPMVLTAANGSNAGGALDRTNLVASALSVAGLTANRAAATPNYIYATLNADGSTTLGSTLLPPIRQPGGVPATTAGQFTFNTGENRGYMGNGATAPQAYIVFLGEAATDATTVIATAMYAYNRLYESAWTATLPGANSVTSANHNIGAQPRTVDFIIECTTAEVGCAVGDQVNLSTIIAGRDATPIYQSATIKHSTKSMTISVPSNAQPWLIMNAGAAAFLTLANWKYKFVADGG